MFHVKQCIKQLMIMYCKNKCWYCLCWAIIILKNLTRGYFAFKVYCNKCLSNIRLCIVRLLVVWYNLIQVEKIVVLMYIKNKTPISRSFLYCLQF